VPVVTAAEIQLHNLLVQGRLARTSNRLPSLCPAFLGHISVNCLRGRSYPSDIPPRNFPPFQEFLDVTEVMTGVVRFSQPPRNLPPFQEISCRATPRPVNSQVKIRSEVSGFPLSQAKSSQCKMVWLHICMLTTSVLSLPPFLRKRTLVIQKPFGQ
jgi:hypothetical protein